MNAPVTPPQGAQPFARKLALFVPLALFIAFLAFTMFNLGRPQQQVIASKMVGQPMPTFTLEGLDALHPGLATEDLQRGTVTLVNVFASWCLPCQTEAPQLQALAEQGVVIHGIAVRDRSAAIGRFLAQHGNPFRRIGLDPAGQTQIALGSSGVPETFVVDGKGVIRYQHIGEIRPEHVSVLLAEIGKAKS